MGSDYAWIVDKTLVPDPDDDNKMVDDTDFCRNGWGGPGDAPDELLRRLAGGEGRVWRTLIEGPSRQTPIEQRVAHVGRYLHLHDGDELGHDAFGPLNDLSKADVGATDIQYQDSDGKWVTL